MRKNTACNIAGTSTVSGALSGRLITLFCLAAVLLLSLPAKAQDYDDGPHPSKVDIYGGYSYLTRQTDTSQGYRFHTMPYGAIAQGAYFFTRNLGVEAGGSYSTVYKTEQINFVQGGPILRYVSGNGALSIYVHGLFGLANMTGPNVITSTSPLTYSVYNPQTWGTAYGGGAGIDFQTPFFNHHVSIRLIQADYEAVNVNFGVAHSGNVSFDATRLSAGLVWHIGGSGKHEKVSPVQDMMPSGPTLACSASPTTVAPGEAVNVTAEASGFDPRYSIAYAWTAMAGHLSGTDATIKIDTRGLAPGSYTVNVHATSGKQIADCTSGYTVASPQPPTISCSASPAIVLPGQQVTITAQGYSPSNRPLTYSFKTSGGTASGAGNSATLATTGLSTGPVNVICNVVDDMGRNAETTASFMVNAPTPPPQTVHTEPLCDISFARDRARPTRVDNEAKACLDSVALAFQRAPDATIVVVGDAAPNEVGGNMTAAQRAVNTKNYLVTEKGIDPARIEARTGGDGTRSVQNFLVPSGADFESDFSGSIAVSSAIQPQARVPLTSRRYATRRTPVRRRRPVHRTTPAPTTTNIPPQQ